MTTEAKPDCPVCGAGRLTEHRGVCEVEHRGTLETRPSWYSVCSECGSEIATAEQMRRNKHDTIAFRKRVDGLLTRPEIARIREQVANITARSRFGMLALPTLRFIPEANNSTD